MRQCSDCYSVKPSSDPPRGDGKCAGCHGSGFGTFFDTAIIEFLNGVPPSCDECYGTGKCQTCMGTGVIDEPNIKIAA